MEKIDLKKVYKNLYQSSTKEPSLVEAPEFQIFSVQGEGNPNTSVDFKNAVETLFPVAFKAKFICKKELQKDYVVMPLEGLWWTDDMNCFSQDNKDIWKWKIFIIQPDFMTKEIFERAKEEAAKKKDLPALERVTFEKIEEGLSAQILHIGSYDNEKTTIEKLHTFIKDKGYSFDGLIQKHHEIYLSDMRKTAPEKLKTILRQPVK